MHWYILPYILGIALTVPILVYAAAHYFRKRAARNELLAHDVWGSTFDAVPDLIAVIDKNFRIIRANRAMAEAVGAAPEELIGRPCYHIMHGTEFPVDTCPHRKLVEDGKPHQVELYEPALRGHFLVSASPLYDRSGGLIGSVHVARNITDRRIAEIALEEKRSALAGRIKELNCLYGISEIVRKPGITLAEILRETAGIIPAAWQHPETASARVTLDGKSFQSHPFAESPWRLASNIVVDGGACGTVEVFYREERGAGDEGPFLREERALIDAIAERLGRVVERRRVARDLKLSEARLEALHTMNNRQFGDEKELILYALEEEVRLTGSEIGYFHFVKEDGVSLELFAWSSHVMETCTAAADRHYPLDRAGVWADCARTGRPAIHNDYANLPDRKGMPEGHSPVIRHASVPVFDGDRVVAISGVANKPDPYNEPDIRQMQLFMDGVWKMVVRKRAEEALARALGEKSALLEKLGESEAFLRDRNEKMEFDLKIAQSAQKAFVRAYRPDSDLVAVEHRYLPMERVGGDYFSFFKSGDGSISFFIGDVSGHGIAAALYVALLKSVTDRVFRESPLEPEVYLGKVNDELVDYISSNFVTAIYGIFTGRGEDGAVLLRYSNGAHVKPVVMRAEGGCEYHGLSGTLIGVSAGINFKVNELALRRGDRLLLLTDGIPETINENKMMIGFERGLIDLIARSRRDSLGETLDAVIEETARYRNNIPQGDDITIIGFEAL